MRRVAVRGISGMRSGARRVTGARPRATGGQINVSGILYQMLVSLADGLEITVARRTGGDGSVQTILHVEPLDGGDVQIVGRRRVVVQIKTRAALRRWSTGSIVSDVLPDLLRSVGADVGDRFQFVTDNDAGCEEFREFLAWFQRPAVERRRTDAVFRWGQGGRNRSARVALQFGSALDRRFEIARHVGDMIWTREARFGVVSRARTDRQKFQRRFAQEFLVPVQALRRFVDFSRPTETQIEQGARYFGVRPSVVRALLMGRACSLARRWRIAWKRPD